MSTFITVLFSLWFGFTAFAESCPKKAEIKELKKVEKKLKLFKPPAPKQAGGTVVQRGNMNVAGANAGAAKDAAGACATTLRGFEKEFKELKEKLETPECESKKNEAEMLEKRAGSKAAECEAAGAQAGGQEDKNKDNEKKMGEGKAPEMKMPEKKEEKKEDPTKKEKERQAKIKECKARANNTMDVKKHNCVADNGGSMAVKELKQKQDECKQAVIFANQADLTECESIQASP